jgi:ribosomal-protein-alanine N-acetyltransferase
MVRVAEIERASFADPWSVASFRSLVGHPQVWFMVATEGDAGPPIGYIVVWFVVDEGEVANLAISPEARRRGIGARLLDGALEAAADRRITRIFLEVRDSNEGARALYASRGFELVGRRRGYYRRPVEDALVLRRVMLERPDKVPQEPQRK